MRNEGERRRKVAKGLGRGWESGGARDFRGIESGEYRKNSCLETPGEIPGGLTFGSDLPIGVGSFAGSNSGN